MKILLTNPPWLRSGWYGVRAGSRWPHMERADSPYMPFPFLLGYAASVLRDDGVEVDVIDACAERMDDATFLERFEASSPDVVMAEISTPSFNQDMRSLKAIRSTGFEGPILVGGLHKPLYQPDFLSRYDLVDGTLVGEYELTLREFLRQGGRPKEPIEGLIWRGRDGVVDGGRKESQTGLDDFPWPARDLFPMDCYHDLPGGLPGPSVQMWASRGCSFTCNFCAWPQILYADNFYRTRSAEAVADEVEAMLAQGYKSFYFDDDTFNLGKKRTEEISRVFTERGFGDVPWGFMGRADTCDPRQYEGLAKTGLQAVKFGVESADSARLRQIGKNLDVARVRESVKMVHSLGIKVHLTFMFGLQGETLDTMQRTLDLAYELDPDSAQFTIAVPFPGSRLHDELLDSGRLEGLEFDDLDGYRTGVVSTDALEAEQVIAFVHGIHRRWEVRSRPAGEAPKIPVSEIGGSSVSVGLLAQAGDSGWLKRALKAVMDQEGPSREIVVVADPSDPSLETSAAEVCPWATFLDAEDGETSAAMINRIPEACTGQWIAVLQRGALPRAGWLQGLIEAARTHRDAGAIAVSLFQGTENGINTGLSMSRWGRVLRHDGGQGPVFAVSSRCGAFSRALLEDSGGFDPRLPAELADADLALRGLVLGYRSVLVDSASAQVDAALPLRAEEAAPGADEVQAWGRGRLHLLLRSLPRESFVEVAPALALELLADVYRAARERRHPAAMVRGLVEGLRESPGLLAERKQVLGRRRVGDRFVRKAFQQAEDDMEHCRWQRVLQALAG